MTIKDLLDGLSAETALASPSAPYTHGVGRAMYELMRIVVHPDTPPGAKVSAVREVAERCEGKPRTADKIQDGDVRLSDLDLGELTDDEVRTLDRLIRKAGTRILGDGRDWL